MNRDQFEDVQDMAHEALCLLELAYAEASEVDEFLRRLIAEAKEHVVYITELKSGEA